jgi:hypothetical protein
MVPDPVLPRAAPIRAASERMARKRSQILARHAQRSRKVSRSVSALYGNRLERGFETLMENIKMANAQDDILLREVRLAVEGKLADVLLDQERASALLGVSPRTMERWRSERSGGPPFIRLSVRAIRYSRAALRVWLMARTVESTGA